jgi:hypothetical protein
MDALRAARAFKSHVVTEYGISAESDLPFCAVLYQYGEPFALVVPHTNDRSIAHFALTFTLGLTDCDAVMALADVYRYATTYDAAAETFANLEPGSDLAVAYADGVPGLSEALMIATWHRDGSAEQITQPYRIMPGRVVEYGAVEQFDVDIHEVPVAGGLLQDAVTEGFELQPLRPFSAVPDWSTLAYLVEVRWRQLVASHWDEDTAAASNLRVFPPFTERRPKRNDPCPCGSNKKAKVCCYR